MSPCIILWRLADRLICGDEHGNLLLVRGTQESELVLSTQIRRLRCADTSFEFRVQRAGAEICIAIQPAIVDGYLVRCGWSPELRTWVAAGQPRLLPSTSN